MSDETVTIVEDEPIHEWFSLSYANYLVLPRSVLQSLPTALQRDVVAVLERMQQHIWPARTPPFGEYHVELHDQDGSVLHDPLADYERGRRHVTPEELQALGSVSA